MKITISLEQLNEFGKLSRTEQQAVINHLNALSKMSETELHQAAVPADDDVPSLAARVQRLTVKRTKDACRRREQRRRRREQQQPSVEPSDAPKFEGAVKHEVKMFETRFKDDFQLLISRHLRRLRKSLRNVDPGLCATVIGYAHSFVRHTLLANVPSRYRAERSMSARKKMSASSYFSLLCFNFVMPKL